MINAGDRIRMLRECGYEFDTDYIYANEGDEGVVLTADHVNDVYSVKFSDGWGGTMTIYHHPLEFNNMEKVETHGS